MIKENLFNSLNEQVNARQYSSLFYVLQHVFVYAKVCTKLCGNFPFATDCIFEIKYLF